jgi:pilus assembly protein CpaF
MNTAMKSKISEYDQLKQRIHQKLIGKLDLSRVGDLEGDVLRREIRVVVEHLCDGENNLLNRSERDRLVDEVLDETFGLGPLELLLKDPTISDILINGPKNIYCERGGKMEKTNVEFRDNPHLLQIIDRIVSKVGRRVDETCPMVDARLEDGSRVNAIIPPLALDGAAMSIRRFGSNPLKLEDLLNYKAFTPEMVMLLEGAMKARLNIVISGGTGSGKTTLAQYAFELHFQRRPNHNDRRRGGNSTPARPRCSPGNAATEHRRQRRGHRDRPREELSSYATGTDHHR